MNLFWEKTQEWVQNLWLKLLGAIPLCFFLVEEREKIMITALLGIITIDCFFGAAVARYIDHNFRWGLLGKKFSRKFLLFFFTLTASFILSRAYSFVSWWFYVIGMIITFSEFGSLLTKSRKLGLPVDSEIINYFSEFLGNKIKQRLEIFNSKKEAKDKDVLLKNKGEKEDQLL